MKRTFILVFAVFPVLVFSQNKFGQTTINAGASYSVWRSLHKIPFRDYDSHFLFTVGKQAAIDRALLRVASIGIGFTWQKHILEIENYQYTYAGQVFTENPNYIVYASSFYIRMLVHHKMIFEQNNDRVDLYGGVQELYILLNSSNTSNDPDFQTINERGFEIPSLVGGVRFYPTNFMGLYAECSVPGAYTVAVGLTFRLGGRETFLK